MIEQREKHEKRNTWRILKELEPVQSLQCRFGWHQWTNWEIWDEVWSKGHVSHATCYCAKCGMPRVETAYSKTKKG
jgi:hypothetical protein